MGVQRKRSGKTEGCGQNRMLCSTAGVTSSSSMGSVLVWEGCLLGVKEVPERRKGRDLSVGDRSSAWALLSLKTKAGVEGQG